ncbi:hypothetical protein NQ318_006809 [Aromia moschata]|uniref:Uncharacterized protein n=1 Tax=Aromia moschata TaxID=1265417 RepID=A0AAV8XQQ2_9CUCU|nr:hypothetical protein NQ318_006809 [Aromia moschata]
MKMRYDNEDVSPLGSCVLSCTDWRPPSDARRNDAGNGVAFRLEGPDEPPEGFSLIFIGDLGRH